MKKILITGATDGIGLETAKRLAKEGHEVLLHGRNPKKLAAAKHSVEGHASAPVSIYEADLSRLPDWQAFADQVLAEHTSLDVLINNAGIYKTPEPITAEGFDVRFLVNTIAPYYLTQKLLPILASDGRIVNLSSAAQAPVSLRALVGEVQLVDAFDAYAQSKLAITMWSSELAEKLSHAEQVVLAVNPGSLLASKMVKEGFGVAGKDINIGVDILCRSALSPEFVGESGQYFDNDAWQLSDPHPEGLNQDKRKEVVSAIEEFLTQQGLV